jgi:hypothetical protein
MNELKVHERESIISLWKGGWSARRIARELGCRFHQWESPSSPGRKMSPRFKSGCRLHSCLKF